MVSDKDIYQNLKIDGRKIQAMLQDHGYDCPPYDGVPSEKFEKALKSFQTRHALIADGLCKPKGATITALNKGLSNRVSNLKQLKDTTELYVEQLEGEPLTFEKNLPLPSKELNALMANLDHLNAYWEWSAALGLEDCDVNDKGQLVVDIKLEARVWWSSYGVYESLKPPMAFTVLEHSFDIEGWTKKEISPYHYQLTTTHAYKSLAASVIKDVDQYLKAVGMTTDFENDKISKRLAAVMIKTKLEKELQDRISKKDKREMLRDTFSSMTEFSEAVWAYYTETENPEYRNITHQKIVRNVFKGIDLLMVAGVIKIRLDDGENKEEVIIGEISSLVAGWAITLGVFAIAGGGAIGVITATVSSLIYTHFGGDEFVAKWSFILYLNLLIKTAKLSHSLHRTFEDLLMHLGEIKSVDNKFRLYYSDPKSKFFDESMSELEGAF